MASLTFVVENNYHVNNHILKIDIEHTRTRCEICLMLIIKTLELFSIVDFEHVFVSLVATFIFIVWMIFIILIIIIVFTICKKIGI